MFLLVLPSLRKLLNYPIVSVYRVATQEFKEIEGILQLKKISVKHMKILIFFLIPGKVYYLKKISEKKVF